jgi:MFS transporter, PAT family, beta-lactamase induction signal transducer AmpG
MMPEPVMDLDTLDVVGRPLAGLAWSPARVYTFVLLFFLYISQSIPASFFIMAFPVLLRQEGTSLNYIGLLNLLILPVIFKALWAPYVDSLGSYRSWILRMQAACIVVMIAVGFFDWVHDFWIVYALCFLYTLCSTTQDIGVDGLAVRALNHRERPVGNGVAVAGQYLGTVIGGGAMIILFNRIGLHACLAIVVGVLGLPMLLLVPYREPRLPVEARIRPSLRAVASVVSRPGMKTWLTVLTVFYLGPMMSGTLVRPLLVDRKIPLETIGFLFGVMSPLLAIAGCSLAPVLINRLGRKRSLVVFGVIGAAQIVSDSLMALGMVGLGTIYGCIAFLGFTSGFSGILAYAIVMDKSEAGSAGTDFTVQVTFVLIGQMAAGVLGGFLGQALGYQGLFGLAMVIQVLVVGWIARAVDARSLHRLEPAGGQAGR